MNCRKISGFYLLRNEPLLKKHNNILLPCFESLTYIVPVFFYYDTPSVFLHKLTIHRYSVFFFRDPGIPPFLTSRDPCPDPCKKNFWDPCPDPCPLKFFWDPCPDPCPEKISGSLVGSVVSKKFR